MGKKKLMFVRLRLCVTFDGVGKTLEEAAQDARDEAREYLNNQRPGVNDFYLDTEQINEEDTNIDNSYIESLDGDGKDEA